MDPKLIPLKQALNKQKLTNWDNTFIKKKLINFHINYEVHLKSSRGQQINSYKKSKFTAVGHRLTMKMVFESTPHMFN